jgi:SHAQKYF class myb-like DNA-binding protein
MFLLGLQKLGKGDWRGISRNYVVSRTPTQVASHAQKYFIRQQNMTRRKRRSSLFDMVPDEVIPLSLSLSLSPSVCVCVFRKILAEAARDLFLSRTICKWQCCTRFGPCLPYFFQTESNMCWYCNWISSVLKRVDNITNSSLI